MNREDVLMLERSMQGLGDTFRQNRLDQERTDQRAVENSLRERMFQSQEKNRIEDNARQEAGSIEAWLQSEGDGAPVRFSGPQKGLESLIAAAGQQGKKLRVVPRPEMTTKKPFKITSELPVGTVEYELGSIEEMQKAIDVLKQGGGKTPNKSPGQSGRVRELQQAIQYREAAEQELDPTKKARLLKFAEDLEAGKPVKLGTEETETATGKVTKNIYGSPNATGAKKFPTRAVAREYVTKYGAQAKQKLTEDGYDPSGYAD